MAYFRVYMAYFRGPLHLSENQRAYERFQKFCEHDQASSCVSFASNSSIGQILRAFLNRMGPFVTPSIVLFWNRLEFYLEKKKTENRVGFFCDRTQNNLKRIENILDWKEEIIRSQQPNDRRFNEIWRINIYTKPTKTRCGWYYAENVLLSSVILLDKYPRKIGNK